MSSATTTTATKTSTTTTRSQIRRSQTSTGSALLSLLENDPDFPTAEGGAVCSSSACATTVADRVVVRDASYYVSTFCAGVGSGICSSIICAPLDLIRTRLQVWGNLVHQTGTTTATTRLPSTPMQVVHDILNKEGPRGLFRGLGATMVTVPLFWGVYFPLYEETKHYVSKAYPHAHPSLVHCGSAVFTGAVADVLCNPLFVIRTRLQTQALHQTIASASSSTSPIQMPSPNPTKTTMATPTMRRTALELYHTHGPTVFWRGMSANLMGLSHVAIQFPTYEFLKSMAQNSHPTEPESAWELLMASGLAKLCASLISYPHEVLRSRMMDSRATIPPTLIGTARDIWTIEGPKGFYRGLPITLFRVLPNCCITFVSYEYLKRWSQDHYHKWQEQQQQQQQRHQQQ